MRISKVQIFYAGFGATNYEMSKEKNFLLRFGWGDFMPCEHIARSPRSRAEWIDFVMQLASATQNWEQDYYSPVCDGIQWSVVFRVDTTWRSFHGSNEFPENFGDFVKLVRSFTQMHNFAEGFELT